MKYVVIAILTLIVGVWMSLWVMGHFWTMLRTVLPIAFGLVGIGGGVVGWWLRGKFKEN